MKCIEDEIPFEVPDGWEWRRLKTICSKIIDGAHNPPKGLDTKTSYIMASSRNINFDTICDLDNVRYLDESAYTKENQRTNVSDGDILLTTVATLGRSCIYRGYPENLTFQRSVSVITTLVKPDYIKIFLDSHFFQNKMEAEATGTAQRGFYLNQLINVLIPVPPERYQKVLAGKVQEYSMQLNNIDDDKADLNETISIIKNKILDLAIHGKLTIQNPNDEPASILLDRIRNEKENFIKQGRIKRDKKESIIYKGDDNSYYEKLSDGATIDIDEDLPFDIPETWCWSRLSSLCRKEIKRGKAPKYIETSGTLVFAQKCNLKKGGIDYTLAQYLDESTLSKYNDSEFIRSGDTVINSTGTGTLGRVGFIDYLADWPIVPDSHVTTIRVSNKLEPYYIFAVLKSMQSVLEKSGEGSTNQKELKPHTIQEIFVPIPPIDEQKRICSCIKQCNEMINNIENSLS